LGDSSEIHEVFSKSDTTIDYVLVFELFCDYILLCEVFSTDYIDIASGYQPLEKKIRTIWQWIQVIP